MMILVMVPPPLICIAPSIDFNQQEHYDLEIQYQVHANVVRYELHLSIMSLGFLHL